MKVGTTSRPIRRFDKLILHRDSEFFVCPNFLHENRPNWECHFRTLTFTGSPKVGCPVFPTNPNSCCEIRYNSHKPTIGIILCGSCFSGNFYPFWNSFSAQFSGSSPEFSHPFHQINHRVGIKLVHYFFQYRFYFFNNTSVCVFNTPNHFGFNVISIIRKCGISAQHFINGNI